MAKCSATSYPFGSLYRRKHSPIETLKFLVTTLINQYKKVAFIPVNEDGALGRSSEFIKICHKMNIVVQTAGGDAYTINGKIESTNKKLSNIKRALLLNSSHKKELWCFAYQYAICLS